MAQQPIVGHCHSDTPHPVELWTNDLPDTDTSARQHRVLTTEEHQWPLRDSNYLQIQFRQVKNMSEWVGRSVHVQAVVLLPERFLTSCLHSLAVLCIAVPCGAVLCYSVPCIALLCCAVQCCAVLCCAVQCCAVLWCALLCCAMVCCTVLCCAVLCCTVLCCAVLSCAVHYSAMLCRAVLCCVVLCYAVLYSGVLCYGVLCSAVLCCTVLCCAVLSSQWRTLSNLINILVHRTRSTNAHMQKLFIVYYSLPTCFDSRRDRLQGNLQDYKRSILTVRMHKRTT